MDHRKSKCKPVWWWIMGILARQLANQIPEEFLPGLRSGQTRVVEATWPRRGSGGAYFHPGATGQPEWHQEDRTTRSVSAEWSGQETGDVGYPRERHERSSPARTGPFQQGHGTPTSGSGTSSPEPGGSQGRTASGCSSCGPRSGASDTRRLAGQDVRCMVRRGAGQRSSGHLEESGGGYWGRNPWFLVWEMTSHMGPPPGLMRRTMQTVPHGDVFMSDASGGTGPFPGHPQDTIHSGTVPPVGGPLAADNGPRNAAPPTPGMGFPSNHDAYHGTAVRDPYLPSPGQAALRPRHPSVSPSARVNPYPERRSAEGEPVGTDVANSLAASLAANRAANPFSVGSGEHVGFIRSIDPAGHPVPTFIEDDDEWRPLWIQGEEKPLPVLSPC